MLYWLNLSRYVKYTYLAVTLLPLLLASDSRVHIILARMLWLVLRTFGSSKSRFEAPT